MKILLILIITMPSLLAQGTPQRGPKGGCYIIVTSKTGKAYKKYVDPSKCKEVKK